MVFTIILFLFMFLSENYSGTFFPFPFPGRRNFVKVIVRDDLLEFGDVVIGDSKKVPCNSTDAAKVIVRTSGNVIFEVRFVDASDSSLSPTTKVKLFWDGFMPTPITDVKPLVVKLRDNQEIVKNGGSNLFFFKKRLRIKICGKIKVPKKAIEGDYYGTLYVVANLL